MTDTANPIGPQASPKRGVLVAVPGPKGGGEASFPAAAPSRTVEDPKARAQAALKERTRAKNAMVVSLGALVLTGYFAARGSRRDSNANAARVAHMVAGVALMGASYWHSTLYGPRQR